MGSANQTATSMISVKDRAMAKFDNCRSAKDPSNVNNFKSMSIDDIDPEALAKWESRKIGPFSFDIDDEIQVPGCQDIEIITNEQVYDDLKEIDDIIDKG